MFELKVKDKVIPLKWGTWAMYEFSKEKGSINERGEKVPLSMNDYFKLLSSPNVDLSNIISFISIGYKSACVSNKTQIEYTEAEVYDWLDEIGGILDSNGQVMEYMKYIVSETVVLLSKKQEVKEVGKKKG